MIIRFNTIHYTGKHIIIVIIIILNIVMLVMFCVKLKPKVLFPLTARCSTVLYIILYDIILQVIFGLGMLLNT